MDESPDPDKVSPLTPDEGSGDRAARRLAAIVESSDDAIVSKDLNGIVTTWNQGAERMFGYTAAEIVGKSITIIIPEDRLHEEREVLTRIRRGDKVDHFETLRRHKSGKLVPISLTVSPIRDASGTVVGASKIARDISYRLEAETERARLLAEVQSHAAVTQKLIQAVQEASRLKDEFLATLSHELRTPLNAILGYARMLRRGQVQADKSDRAIEVIERNAVALTQIVEDVLDVARITAGKVRLNIQAVDPVDLVRNAILSVAPAADARGVRIETVVRNHVGMIAADADRLQQVLWNLLSNAVKFTGRGGAINIELSKSEGDVEIIVSDTGIGIPPDFLPYLFDRFRQADARTTREQGGLGLGLAIARHFTEMHGGTISASSRGEGQGSTFRVRLPVMAAIRALKREREAG
jgi:PAS domain S-box-containing protein